MRPRVITGEAQSSLGQHLVTHAFRHTTASSVSTDAAGLSRFSNLGLENIDRDMVQGNILDGIDIPPLRND